MADTNYSLILMKMKMKMKMGSPSEGIGMVKIPSNWEDELPSYALFCNELFLKIVYVIFI